MMDKVKVLGVSATVPAKTGIGVKCKGLSNTGFKVRESNVTA
jgi:hypothetical protein